MTWFKVDDGLAFHPKAIAAGNAALGLWVRAGAWCSNNLTDGALPRHMIGTLGAQARDARRLVAAGLWCETSAGYQFNDWEHYQPSKQQVTADRQAAKERQRRHREQSRHAGSNGVSHTVTDGVTSAAPTRPDPTLSGLGSQSALGRSGSRTSDGPDLTKIAAHLGSDERWAKRVATQILDHAATDVRDPTAYVLRAIDERPGDHRPTPTAPRKDQLCDEHGRDRATCPASWHEASA